MGRPVEVEDMAKWQEAAEEASWWGAWADAEAAAEKVPHAVTPGQEPLWEQRIRQLVLRTQRGRGVQP